MQRTNRPPHIAIAVAFLLLVGCASTGAPSGWLSSPKKIPTDPYGGWVTIECKDGSICGELIAVSEDTLFLADSCLHAIPVSTIRSARLAVYEPEANQVALGTFGGTVMSLTNGVFFLLTAPMWIVGGSIAASARSRESIIDYPYEPINRFAAYARFPQGLSASLHRETIRVKHRQ